MVNEKYFFAAHFFFVTKNQELIFCGRGREVAVVGKVVNKR